MKYFLGIDGGGTSTEYTLIDELGNILATAIGGTTHIMQISRFEFAERLTQGVKKCTDTAGIKTHEITYTFAGIPGYGEFEEHMTFVSTCIHDILGSKNFTIGNDCVAGWASGHAGAPGINLVSGTGSIGYGRDSQGREFRSGGWGDFCGDEGSAYWLGKKLTELFAKQSDGRIKKGPLYDIVREELYLETDFQIIGFVTDILGKDRTKIADLSKLLYIAAASGDESAISAYADAAYELCLVIKAVANGLEFDSIIPVTVSGGVFNAGDFIMVPLLKCLGDSFEYKTSVTDPAKGAALLAYVIDGGEINDEFLKNLNRVI